MSIYQTTFDVNASAEAVCRCSPRLTDTVSGTRRFRRRTAQPQTDGRVSAWVWRGENSSGPWSQRLAARSSAE
jgi:hypothetical protein